MFEKLRIALCRWVQKHYNSLHEQLLHSLYWRERLCGSKRIWGEHSEGVVSSFAMGSRGVQPVEVTPLGQDRDWGGLL